MDVSILIYVILGLIIFGGIVSIFSFTFSSNKLKSEGFYNSSIRKYPAWIRKSLMNVNSNNNNDVSEQFSLHDEELIEKYRQNIQDSQKEIRTLKNKITNVIKNSKMITDNLQLQNMARNYYFVKSL